MTGRHILLVLILAGMPCAGSLAATTVTTPQTLYVDASYDGAEAGTSAKPYSRLSAALAQAYPGRSDTVIVRKGTYAESVLVPIATTLISEDGAAHTFIEGSSGTLVRLQNGAILRGFTIGGTSDTAVMLMANAAAEVTNCVFHDSGTGFQVNSNGAVSCTNNTVNGNGIGIRCEAGGKITPLENNSLSSNAVGVSAAETATIGSKYNAFYDNTAVFAGSYVPGALDFVSNPLYVDAGSLNFHLRAISNLRDGGDPGAGFNDPDGTRNDVGVDGGSHGAVDLLAPQVQVVTDPEPAQGTAPLALLVDASGAQDEWGVQTWEWDTNIADGLTFGDGSGASLPFLFDEPGGYYVYVRVTDNSGVSAIASFPVRVGAPPQVVRLEASPAAGPAPLSVAFQMEAVSLIGGSLSYYWDFDGDNVTDSTEQNPSFIFPAGSSEGMHRVSLVVVDEDNVATQAFIPVTISAYAVTETLDVKPGTAAELQVNDSQSALDGMLVQVPARAFAEKMVLAVGEVSSSALPILPTGSMLKLFDLSPKNVLLSQEVTVRVPVSGTGLSTDNVKIWYWNPDSQAWFDAGISHTRVKDGTVSFDTSHFTIFAIVRTDGAGGPCFIASAAYGTPLAKEIDVLRGLRDRLLDVSFGAALVDAYYRISPPVADAVAGHPALAYGLRAFLTPLIALLKHPVAMTALVLLFTMAGLRRLLRAG